MTLTALGSAVTLHSTVTLTASRVNSAALQIGETTSTYGANAVALKVTYVSGTEATGLNIIVSVSIDGTTYYDLPTYSILKTATNDTSMIVVSGLQGFEKYMKVGIIAVGSLGTAGGTALITGQLSGIRTLALTS